MSGFLVGQRSVEQPGTPAAAEQAFQPFWDSYDAIIKRFALGGETQQSLIDGAIKGMVDSLGDPYSAYLTPDEYSQGLQDLSGQFEGIGAEIGTATRRGATSDCTTLGPDCFLIVVTPIEGSPSEKAGVKAGDAIVAVDGASLDGLTVDEARNKIRGKKGTEVVLSIVRGKAAPIDITVVRDVIVSKEVIAQGPRRRHDRLHRGHRLLGQLPDEVPRRPQADLRRARRSSSSTCAATRAATSRRPARSPASSSRTGPIFWEQDADGNRQTDATGHGDRHRPSIKLVVLVDKGSASASEIVAGALQDTKRATIVGETSFGKGTVQQWIQLQNGSALKLTIAKWLTPGQALDPPRRDRPGRRRSRPRPTPAGQRPGPRQGGRAARRGPAVAAPVPAATPATADVRPGVRPTAACTSTDVPVRCLGTKGGDVQ